MITNSLARRLAVVALPALLLTGLVAAPGQAAGPSPVTSTMVSANPANNTPHARNGAVNAFAEIGGTVYVGGSFTSIRTATSTTAVARPYLFAYNRSTGALVKTFLPALNGAVHALAVSPDGKLLVGGAFKTVNTLARKNLVKLDPVTGATVKTWVGVSDGGLVRRIVRHGDSIYVAGAFRYINGRKHSLLARLDAATGAVDQSFQVDASVARTGQELVWGMAVAPNGRTLVAVGNFTRVNGMSRNQVVLVDLTGTPAVADWSTTRYVLPCGKSFPFYARDVDFSDDGSYFVIGADGSYQKEAYCDSITRWETGTRGSNLDATWINQTGRDSVTAVEVSDNVVYVAGHFRWLNNSNGLDKAGSGAVSRFGYGALNPVNGMPMAWNPTRTGAPAGTVKWGPIVSEVWRGAAGLYSGFDNDGAGREYHGRLAYFPLAGGKTAPAVNAPSAKAGYLYLRGATGAYTKVAFDGTTLGESSTISQSKLTGVGAAFIAGNRLYSAKTDGTLQVSTFSASGQAGAPWLGSTYNAWFKASAMSGAFLLNGRMYYTAAGSNELYYRYFEPNGALLGCTRFVVPSSGVAWGVSRGMTWAAGRIVFGGTDGKLRSVPFTGDSVDGTAATVLATPTASTTWSSPTLFYAAS